MSDSYLIGFDITAETKFAAISEAVGKLRTGVKLNGVHRIDETAPGLWHVVQHVFEDV